MDMQQVDDEIFQTLNEVYDGKLRTIKERDVNTDDGMRHIAFDAWTNEGKKLGIHVYYSLEQEEVIQIYESAGENFDMPEF